MTPEQFTHVPEELKAVPRWLVYRLVPKRNGQGHDKVPVDKNWNELPEAFASAYARASKGKDLRLGFWFADTDDIGGVDLDACRDPQTGEILQWARTIIDIFGTYAEVSPSGTGVKLFARGCQFKGKGSVPMEGGGMGVHAQAGIEVYGTSGFFAVTGQKVEGCPSELRRAEIGWAMLRKMLGDYDTTSDQDELDLDDVWNIITPEMLESLLANIDPRDHNTYWDWFGILCSSHNMTGGDEEALNVFVRWSAQNPEFAHLGREVRIKWRSLERTLQRKGTGSVYGPATVLWHLRNDGAHAAERLFHYKLSAREAFMIDRFQAGWSQMTWEQLMDFTAKYTASAPIPEKRENQAIG